MKHGYSTVDQGYFYFGTVVQHRSWHRGVEQGLDLGAGTGNAPASIPCLKPIHYPVQGPFAGKKWTSVGDQLGRPGQRVLLMLRQLAVTFAHRLPNPEASIRM